LKSMIRVHDLSNEKRMKLVGSYDFPDASPLRRYVPGINGNICYSKPWMRGRKY
jgi:hypothetical protein